MGTYGNNETTDYDDRDLAKLVSVLKGSFTLRIDGPSVDCKMLAHHLLRTGYRYADPTESHVIEIAADGCTIKHPLRCRVGDLFACPVTRAADALDGPPVPLGRYECEQADGSLIIGTRVPVS